MFLLVLVFIVVPIAELYVIIKVGGAIGVGPTIGLLLLDSLLGAFLLRHQGRASWVAFNRALAENRVPAREILDGVLVIFGGALLLTPGFITDVFGLILLIPPTRAAARAISTRLLRGRVSVGPRAAWWGYDRVRGRGRREARRPSGAPADGAAAGGDPWSGFAPRSRRRGGPRPGDIDGTAEEITERDSLERDSLERGAAREGRPPGGEPPPQPEETGP